METIGERLKYLRSNMTQEKCAALTGIHRGNIGKYENNFIKPSSETLIAYSKGFDVSVDWILFGEVHQNSTKSYAMELFESLPKDYKIKVIGFMEGLLSK